MKTPNFKNESLSKIEVFSTKTRNTIINEMLPTYDVCSHTRNLCVNWFYQAVFSVTKTKTGYRSNDAFSKDTDVGVTDDHYLAPRLLIRALIENERDILYDEKEFLKIFTLCTQTVTVTKKQNNIVRFKNDDDSIIVSELTINKYDKFATWWDNESNDFDEFPLKNTVPDFLTKFETSNLKKY
jgi:hypothetical protein